MKTLSGTSITLACTLLLAGCSSRTTMRDTVASDDVGAYRAQAHPVRAGAARARFEAAPDGQRLRGEAPLAGTSYEQIAAMANAARGPDPEGYRAEFVKLVRMADALGKVAQAGRP